MNQDNYTSLALSKWLQEHGFEGESEYNWWFNDIKGEWKLINDHMIEDINIPAYDIANDLLIEYIMEHSILNKQ